MNVLVLGAGKMGRAIAYDLEKFSSFETITIGDNDTRILQSAQKFFKKTSINTISVDVTKKQDVRHVFQSMDMVISAVPYRFNFDLAKLAITTQTHFVDLGGNNTIVQQEKSLHQQAKKNHVTIIPDSGLAPGLVSVITRDIVDHMDMVHSVKLRVGGLPVHPQPPLSYQIVFSPYGLINEYVENTMILDHGKVLEKPSMTDLETLKFPQPFGRMEAFLTSGGCSTLPYTYRKTIKNLDYKTIRYPGHCEKIKLLLDLGFADETSRKIQGIQIAPRDVLVSQLINYVPTTGDDVVLLKVLSEGLKKKQTYHRDYTMIDYCDKEHTISAMMRTTGYPVSITAQMIEKKIIDTPGVYCPEEIVPPTLFFAALKKTGN